MSRRKLKGVMKLFGSKVFQPSEPEMDGKVLIRINVEKIDRKQRKVSIKINERIDGELVFSATYQTDKAERPSYYFAEDIVKNYCKENDWIIDGGISTNVSLPYVGMSRKRMR